MIHQFQPEQNSVAAAESQRYAPMKQLIGSRKSSQLYENNQNLCSEKVHPLYASASTKQGYQEKSKQGKVIAQNIYPEQIKTKMLKEGYAKELRKRVKWFKVILFTYFHYYNHFVMVKKMQNQKYRLWANEALASKYFFVDSDWERICRNTGWQGPSGIPMSPEIAVGTSAT